MSKFGGYEEQPFIAELYDFMPGYTDRPDLDFYLDLSRSTDGKILELGCGTGRVLIPTAAAGSQVVGLDLSEYMLARCREKLRSRPDEVQDRVRLVQGTMTDFELRETFGLVTTPFRPFQHLVSVVDQLACLQCVNRHLSIGGKLVLDLFQVDPRRMYDPVYTQESEDFPEIDLPDGRRLRRTHRTTAFRRTEQINDIEMTYHVTHPDRRIERLVQAFPFRYFFRYEVEHLLARCGFRTQALFGSFDRSPLTNDSPEMIFIAEKYKDTTER